MSSSFDDPEVREAMARAGIVHQPGMAKRHLDELAPLLAAEGIDLDDLGGEVDLDALGAALARANAQRNLLLTTPTGTHRATALTVVRHVTLAIASGDAERAQGVMTSIRPEPVGDAPAASHVIGVSLGLLDDWARDPTLQGILEAVRVPVWRGRAARAAATDILGLARKGRAFDALDQLIVRHRGLAVLEGGCLAVAASVISRAAREGRTVTGLADELLTGGRIASDWAPTPVAPDETPASRRSPAAPNRAAAPGDGSAFRRQRQGDAAALDHDVALRFGAWLSTHDDIGAHEAAQAAHMLEGVFVAARSIRLDPHDPAGVEQVFEVLDANHDDEAQEHDPAMRLLDAYLHFRIATAGDPEAWEDVHDLVEAAMADDAAPSVDMQALEHALEAAAATSQRTSAAQQRAALNATRVVGAVGDFLDWLGSGTRVTSTGGLRRADIEPVAAMLGLRVVGVARLPQPSLDDPDDAPLHVQSLFDAPLLAAWWEAMLGADVIKMTPTRVYPGPAAADWSSTEPPLDVADMLLGVFVAHVIGDGARVAALAGVHAQAMIRRLQRAIAPEVAVPVDDRDDDAMPERIGRGLAERTLRSLAALGILEPDADGESVVPVALRGTVARGIMLSISLRALDGDFEA